MNDNVKLIISINSKTYNDIKVGKIYSSLRDVPLESAKAIAGGIPLDNVKAEIIADIELLKADGLANMDAVLSVIDKYFSQD